MEKAIYEKAIYDLVFAYVNKDEDFPHSFEVNALNNAASLLADDPFVSEAAREARRKAHWDE